MRYHNITQDDMNNGDGLRVVLWVAGCEHHCKGCQNPVTWKRDWWQMIQLLPSSYNQKRTVQLNYAVLKNIYHARRNHKLDEWHTFCHFIESLPHSELITE